MTTLAAEDFQTIARTVAYEDGFRTACNGADRSAPADCKMPLAWYGGYDEGKKLKKTEV